MFAACLVLLRRDKSVPRPEIHRDDYKVCWVLSGRVPVSTLPDEKHELTSGEAIPIGRDPPSRAYEALENCEVVVIHLRKGKRF